MSIHEQFKQRLNTEHYASAFMSVLINRVETSSHKTFSELINMINKQAEVLLSECSKDTSILDYRNPICLQPIDYLFKKITTKAMKKYGSDIESFKIGLLQVFKQFIEIIKNSTERIVTNSKDLLKSAGSVLTCSYSKAITASLINVNKQRHGNLIVYVCESNPFKQGRLTYNQLTKAGVDCKLIFDSEIGNYTNKVDVVVLGAQVVLENGSVLSRVGTQNLALSAFIKKKPVYILAESYKFLRKFILRQADLPQVKITIQSQGYTVEANTIDLTPCEHINLICSDLGLFTTSAMSQGLIKLFQ